MAAMERALSFQQLEAKIFLEEARGCEPATTGAIRLQTYKCIAIDNQHILLDNRIA
jgi:hypothetical protein